MKHDLWLGEISLLPVCLLLMFSACHTIDPMSPVERTPEAKEEIAKKLAGDSEFNGKNETSAREVANSSYDPSNGNGRGNKNGKGKGGKDDSGTVDPDILLTCGSTDYISGVSMAQIGPRGGTIDHGSHRLFFPPGALPKTVMVSVSMPSPDSLLFELGPHGIQFNKNMSLTLTYKNSCAGDLEETEIEIVYFDAESEAWRPIACAPLYGKRQVRGYTKHFSRYALSRR